jgi:hypothetical protein
MGNVMPTNGASTSHPFAGDPQQARPSRARVTVILRASGSRDCLDVK